MPIANGITLPNSLSNGTTADAVPVMANYNALLNALNRALLDGGGTAGMNAQSTVIHNLSPGVAGTDAINLNQLNTSVAGYLPLTGGTLTGGLVGTTLSLSSTLSASGAATMAAITASGLITGNAGFSGTTLALSSTLSVTGTSTLAALSASGAATMAAITASGLITGNAGFSGTAITLSAPVALQLGPNAAIRDATNGASTIFFDVSTGGAAGGFFSWRTTSALSQKMSLDATGILTVAGTTVWVNANKLLLQHDGTNGFVRAQSGSLFLGGNALNTLTLDAAGTATFAGNGVISGSLTVSGGYIPNAQTVVSAATVTPTFANDIVTVTAQAVALNLANPTGTATEGAGIMIRVKDNGTARAITYGTQYVGIGLGLPATTVAGKVLVLGMIYNASLTRWEVVSQAQE